jgi:hypothetical protein
VCNACPAGPSTQAAGAPPCRPVTELSSTELTIRREALRAEPRAVNRGALARAALRACRPRQWAKNTLLLAAPAAGGALGDPAVGLAVAGAVVAFCMLASATYLLNDVRDVEQDRAHHHKQARPIASGALSVRAALALAALLAVGGLGLAFAVRPALLGVGCGYLAPGSRWPPSSPRSSCWSWGGRSWPCACDVGGGAGRARL